MRRPIVIATLIGIALAVATLALVVGALVDSIRYRCEVCVTFVGRTECREAVGPTAAEASRTAQDNACAFLASGMTQVVSCTSQRPTSSSCVEE